MSLLEGIGRQASTEEFDRVGAKLQALNTFFIMRSLLVYSSPGKGSSAPKTGKKNIHDIITSIYIHLPIFKAIHAVEFT